MADIMAKTVDERLDRLVNIDFGGRGVAELYAASRSLVGAPLCRAAAEHLASIPEGAVVLLTTGSVSRAWVSGTICENDGPAGLAAVVRALSLAKRVIPVVLAEEALLPVIGEIMRAAGLSIVTMDQAHRAVQPGGNLAVVVLRGYPLDDVEGFACAGPLLDELNPALLFSSERVGRAANGIYHNMRGADFGMGRARIDYVFDAALERGIPTVAVGDGGNEIGMGVIAEAVKAAVPHGDRIGAITKADVLMTAACSNWGCYAIVASFARLLKNPLLLHTPQMEERLLQRGVEVGLINSVDGIIDANVDGIGSSAHKALVLLIQEIVR